MSKRARCAASGGKYAYPTFAAAAHAALVSSRRRGVALRPYTCPDCGTWHLTKRPANPVVATVIHPQRPRAADRATTGADGMSTRPDPAWVTTHQAILPCYEGVPAGEDQIYAPPGKVVTVCVVAERVFLGLCDYEDDATTTTLTETAEAQLDASALLNALIAQMGVERVRLALPLDGRA